MRAQHNRGITEEPFKLFEALAQKPVQKVRVRVPRQSARPNGARGPKRRADLSCAIVQLRPPKYYPDKEPCWVIQAREDSPPSGTEAIEWLLLSTVPIASPEEAVNACAGIACGGALKTGIGCWPAAALKRSPTEARSASAGRLRSTCHRADYADDSGQMPAEVLFSDLEIHVLGAYAKKTLEPALAAG